MLPKEIVDNILFQYLDDIELKITFKNFKKIDPNNYKNIEKVVNVKPIIGRDTIYSYSIYRFLKIHNSKYYRINLNNMKGEKFNHVQVSIINTEIPIPIISIGSVYY